MFFRSTHNGRSDATRTACPGFCATPAIIAHQINQSFSHSARAWQGIGPFKKLGIARLECDQNKSRTELSHAVVGRLQDVPLDLITKLGELRYKIASVLLEFCGCEAGDVFEHYGPWLHLFNQSDCRREHVSLIIGAELFTCNSEGRTGYSTSEQINTREFFVRKSANVLLAGVPLRPVFSQSRAIMRLIFN